MGQHQNEWIQKHFSLHQNWLENLKKDSMQEVSNFERKVSEVFQKLELQWQQFMQDSQGATEPSINLVGLQCTVQGLTGQMIAFESPSKDLKFAVNTNLKA